MKKLSPAQAKLLNEMIEQVQTARSYESYEAYYRGECGDYRFFHARGLSDEYIFAKKDFENQKAFYEAEKSGIILTVANGATLRKLAELGLIEIIEDSTNQNYSVDTVKVLNI